MSPLSSVITRFIRDLLAPPGDICLTCRGKSILTREWPGICRHCAEAIPWIDRPRCMCCGRAVGCPDCLRQEAQLRSFILNRSAVQYNDAMREWLAQYKYRGNERYAQLLIRMMGRALDRMLQEISHIYFRDEPLNRRKLWKPDVITYVPVSGSRLIERGFNQAQVLAEGLGAMQGLPVMPLLVRRVHTEKQSFKSRQERIDSMRHAFEWNPDKDISQGFKLMNRHGVLDDSTSGALRILLVDDIYTTGSTINACAEVLRHAFMQVYGLHTEVFSLTWARS